MNIENNISRKILKMNDITCVHIVKNNIRENCRSVQVTYMKNGESTWKRKFPTDDKYSDSTYEEMKSDFKNALDNDFILIFKIDKKEYNLSKNNNNQHICYCKDAGSFHFNYEQFCNEGIEIN